MPGRSSPALRWPPDPAWVAATRALESRPEQKPRPSPVKTMAVTSGSASARRTNPRISPSIGKVSAFSVCGRLSRISATRPIVSNWISPSLMATSLWGALGSLDHAAG